MFGPTEGSCGLNKSWMSIEDKIEILQNITHGLGFIWIGV